MIVKLVLGNGRSLYVPLEQCAIRFAKPGSSDIESTLFYRGQSFGLHPNYMNEARWERMVRYSEGLIDTATLGEVVTRHHGEGFDLIKGTSMDPEAPQVNQVTPGATPAGQGQGSTDLAQTLLAQAKAALEG